jgi:hypothetical protein
MTCAKAHEDSRNAPLGLIGTVLSGLQATEIAANAMALRAHHAAEVIETKVVSRFYLLALLLSAKSYYFVPRRFPKWRYAYFGTFPSGGHLQLPLYICGKCSEILASHSRSSNFVTGVSNSVQRLLP